VAQIVCNRDANGTKGVLKKAELIGYFNLFNKTLCGYTIPIAKRSGIPLTRPM
jgi:hypothetical protein